MIRVLQALTTGSVGGTEQMALALLSRLDRQRFASSVTVLDGRGEVADQISALGIATSELDARGGYAAAVRRFARLVRSARPDVVHVYGFRMSIVARAALATMRHRPALLHGVRGLHLGDWPDLHAWQTRAAVLLERLLSSRVDLYVANSESATDFLTSRGLPRGRFRVVANGVDTAFWAPGTSDAPRPPTFVCIANLRPIKRLELVVDAAAILRERYGNACRVVIAGEGPGREALERKIAALGLQSVVTLTGRLPSTAVRSLLQAATASLLTSAWEGMPVSVLESLACGCPVIGTDVPGIRTVIDHEVTGLLVESVASAVAGACGRLVDDPALRARLSAAARQTAVHAFSADRMVSEYESLYTALAEGRRA